MGHSDATGSVRTGLSRLRRGRRAVLGAGAVLMLAAGGVAWATIPDSGTLLIHGCYSKTTGALRVIDPSKGQTCAGTESPLNWNQKGLNARGNWSPAVAYAPADTVTQNGATYVARNANTNSRPPSANWFALAQHYANVFSKSNSSDPGTFPIILGSNLTPVAQTTALPAGSYQVSAQAVVFMDNGAQDITCDLVDSNGNFANGTAETSGPADSSSTGTVQTLTLIDAFANEPAGTQILLKCAKANGADASNSEVSSAALAVNQVAPLVFNGTTFNGP